MSKQIMIKGYDYQKVEREVPFNLPTEPLYLFETGIRRSIRVVPVWTTWNKNDNKEEEVWKLNVTCVYLSFKNKVESFDIQISQISNILRSEKSDLYELVSLINDPENIRTKEQFDTDLSQAIKNFNEYE